MRTSQVVREYSSAQAQAARLDSNGLLSASCSIALLALVGCGRVLVSCQQAASKRMPNVRVPNGERRRCRRRRLLYIRQLVCLPLNLLYVLRARARSYSTSTVQRTKVRKLREYCTAQYIEARGEL